MFGSLRGKILHKEIPWLVLEVAGVGYELQMSLNDFANLQIGEEVLCYTHFIPREDGWFLYGFLQRNDRELFRELIKVTGVGAKIALAVLSVMSREEFIQALCLEEEGNLSRISGVGNKMAKRLITELKDRAGKWEINRSPLEGAFNDAISALVNLGYTNHVAGKLLYPFKGQNLTSEELIRKALQSRSKEG